jgi:diguanylate cyclase (GGDEF)-like protein/PAS domain S-box-containing protein
LFALAAVLAILAAAVFFARYRIRRVTAEIVERNRQLQEEVAERHRAEGELRERENQLRTLIDNVNALVFIKDVGGRYTLVNKRFEDVLGVSPEQVLGRTDYEVFPAHAEQYMAHDREVFASGSPLQCEETTELGGSPRTFWAAKVPLFDASGTLYALCGVSSDITEQKTAAQAVAEERSFLQAVIDGVVDPIMVIGLDHRVLMMNEAVRRHLPQDLKANSAFCYEVSAQFRFACDDHERSCLIEQVQASGQPLTIARRQTHDDGESHILEIDVSPLRGRDGTLQGVIEVSRDITERLKNEERLQENEVRLNYLVYHDALTELPNRVLFNDRLQQALGTARRQSGQVAILFLDLDRFKNINDSLGHEIGDKVLMEVAKRLRYWARESDTVARLGGDEFLLILEDIHDVTYVAMFANKILGILAQPVAVENHELYVTGSLGISLFPADGVTGDTLLKAADAAMYKAKGEGKNTYQFYTPDMNARAHELLLLEGDLRKALEFEQLVLHYQPQFELDGGELVGMEALVRWRHPRRGLVSPGDFIPLAEETGLIVPLGEWVLRQACLQNRAWQQQGLPQVRMAVNISARQFRQPDFVDQVDRILSETGLAPDCLELEITESVVMEDFSEAIMTLTDLKVRGIHLSIDDFGTGYSSLSYLKRFPISKLKIDQDFVRDVTVDANDAAIAASVIALAQSMNLEVIAEGVETEAQLDFLLEKGCRQGQGFLLGRPLPAGQAEHFFKGRAGR